MGMREFLKEGAAIKLGLKLGRTFSLKGGRRLADVVGKLWSLSPTRQKLKAIKANQWVVSGGTLDRKELNKQALAVCQSISRSLFDYYYYYQHAEEAKRLMKLTPRVESLIKDIVIAKKPTLILGPHLGNFDLFGMMLAWLGVKPYVLSVPNPSKAYEAENELRRNVGLDVHPLSFSSFRKAKQMLRSGRSVVTGLDRPVESEETKYPIRFFGRNANLPGFYIRLALDTAAIVRVGFGLCRADGSFLLECSDPIEMKRYDDSYEEVVRNVESVVSVAERYIRAEASHWAMFFPVWQEAFEEIEHLR